MTYQISIALIHDNQIEDTLNATCSRTYDARVLIESLCNGWQMSSKRIVLINGKLLAIGNPRAIREQLSQHQCLTLTLMLKRTNETLVLAAWPEALENRIYPAITRSNRFITSWSNQHDCRNQNRRGNQDCR